MGGFKYGLASAGIQALNKRVIRSNAARFSLAIHINHAITS